MRRTGYDGHIRERQRVQIAHILHHGLIVVRYDALDGRYHPLAGERHRERREKILQKSRRRSQHHGRGCGHHGVQIVRRSDQRAVYSDIGQILRIVSSGTERVEHAVVADIPFDAAAVYGQRLHDSRSPASVTYYSTIFRVDAVVSHRREFYWAKVDKFCQTIAICPYLFRTFVRYTYYRDVLGTAAGATRRIMLCCRAAFGP